MRTLVALGQFAPLPPSRWSCGWHVRFSFKPRISSSSLVAMQPSIVQTLSASWFKSKLMLIYLFLIDYSTNWKESSKVRIIWSHCYCYFDRILENLAYVLVFKRAAQPLETSESLKKFAMEIWGRSGNFMNSRNFRQLRKFYSYICLFRLEEWWSCLRIALNNSENFGEFLLM